MKLQRILAKDSRSANEQAIAKYGRDVLVVSNSRVNGMTELIVAVDVEPEKMPPPQMPRAGADPFESTLRQQMQASEPAASRQAPSAMPLASNKPSLQESSTAATAGLDASAADGFVPAHMALMQAAQRAAAQSLGQSEPLRAAPLQADTAPATPKPAARPSSTACVPGTTLRYGQQFSLGSHTTMSLPMLAMPATVVQQKSVTSAQAARPSVPAQCPEEQLDESAGLNSASNEDLQDINHQAPAVNSDKAHALTELIRAEIAQLRKEMRMGQQLNAWAAQGPSHRWNEALTEVGVPTALRALLMSGLSNDYDDEQALAAIEHQMVENLPRVRTGRGRRSAPLPWTTGVHLLSGPCGSGKTSMAARLAHEAAQRLGVERVVLVSWNDNRPGAWGQLQLWASRIGVSAFRAADSGTLDLLLQEHRGSLIIVDSGLSQPDILNAAVQGLNAHHHLVMPADANAATLRRWLGEHTPAWSDLIITRLDESAQPWPLLQACCEHQLSPALASDGSGLNHLRLPYDADALLQHGMGILAAVLGAPAGEHPGALGSHAGLSLEIPTIDHITTTVPPRQAGRSGRSAAAKPAVSPANAAGTSARSTAKPAAASTRTRQGASHA